jgi:uridine kinase
VEVQELLTRIAALEPRRGFVLVGIAGHGASGKTTLARAVPGATVVGTDEFWNGGEFELARLRREVLDRLLAGKPARYRPFDWPARRLAAESRVVRPEGVIVVDGVCALHRMFRRDYDLRIWVETPRAVRLARALAREGEQARALWLERWMPMEERYVRRDDPVSAADVVIDGTRLLPDARSYGVARRPTGARDS